MGSASRYLIAIGASTGGTVVIEDILRALPENLPGVVITQHISGAFSKNFADRINDQTQLTMREAEDQEPILPGHVYLAPSSHHLKVDRRDDQYICRLDDGPAVLRHKPSVNVLFESVAACAGRRAIGVLLTGMGKDGAEGMVKLHEAGAITIAHSEESSVIWGMPGEAVKQGAVRFIMDPQEIAEKITACTYSYGTI